MPTFNQVIQDINQKIIPNDNQEITANVLRPILIDMLTQPNELVGDLTLMNIPAPHNQNVVTAINYLISNNYQFTVYQGSNNPNIVSPTNNPKPLDFYIRNSPNEVYLYNGLKWVVIADDYISYANIQSLTQPQKDIALSNIGGLAVNMSNLPSNLTIPEQNIIKNKLGILDQNITMAYFGNGNAITNIVKPNANANYLEIYKDLIFLEPNDLDGFIYDVQYNSSTHEITFYSQNQPNIVIDLPIESLITNVQLVGDDLIFTFEDGSTVTVPLNTLLVGVVKSVNGITPNSQGEVVLQITDIPGLQSALNSKQNQLIAGANISIDPVTNVISATNNIYTGSTSIILSGTSFERAALTGDVTAGQNSNTLTIVNDSVTNLKLANVPTGTIKGRVATGTGDPTDLTAAQVRTLLNVANGANNYVLPPATTSTLGGVIVGSNLSIDSSGVLSAVNTNITQVLSISGQILSLSNGGGSVTIPYTDWANIPNKPTTFPPSAHTHFTNQITALTGYVLGTNASILATDSLNVALGKIQAQINSKTSNTGTVTSITAGTGLSGGTINTSGTIALNSATIASLALADTALQSGDNISELNNDVGYITSSALPNVGNGALNITVPIGLSVTGAFTANQSSNSTFALSYASGYQGFTTSESNKLAGIQAGANNYTHPNHTGDVTSVGDGATTIVNNAVTTAKIANSAVTHAKYQNIAQNTFLGRVASGSGAPTALTAAQMQSALGYLTSFTETDPTVPTWVKGITTSDITNWNNKQNALAAGNHIDITSNVISVDVNSSNYEVLDVKRNSPSAGSAVNFVNDSGKLGDIGFGVINNDFTVRGAGGSTLFRINQANNVPSFPNLPSVQTGTTGNLAYINTNGQLWRHQLTIGDLITQQNIGGYIPASQTLITNTYSVNNNTGGYVGITGGNDISISSVGRNNLIDRNDLTNFGVGLFPVFNTTGSTNYPSGTGAGIVSVRNNTNSAGGNLMLWTSGSNAPELYFDTSGTAGWFGMRIVADRDWVTQQITNAGGNYLEKTSLALSPVANWDTLAENRIVHSTSAANSPYLTYGVGINLYGSTSMRGQLFLNTLNSGGTDSSSIQYRTANASGWSGIKTVWDDSNFNPNLYLPLAGGAMTGNINLANGNANITHGTNIKLRTTSDSLVLSGNTTSSSLGVFIRPQGDTVLTGQVLIDGNGQINTTNHGNSSQWNDAYLATQNLSTNYWTTNTSQTGLTGDKETSGILTFNGTQANSLSVRRTIGGTLQNSTMAFGFNATDNIWMGAADTGTFAIGLVDANIANTSRQRLYVNATSVGTADLPGSYISGRDQGGFTVDKTSTSANWSSIIRHNFSGVGRTAIIGGINGASAMNYWGMAMWDNAETVNGFPAVFFGFVGNNGNLRATSLAGTGNRVVTANANGDLSTATLTNGTVTSVSSSVAGTALNVNVTNPTSTPALGFTWTGTNAQVVLGNGTLGTIPAQLVYTGSNGINVAGTVISPVYGTTANTIAQGNDSRILNGQTAFGWGNHAGLYVPLGRTLTINGTTFDLSANRTWNIPDNDTITRLRGTTSGTFVSGDITFLAGANTAINQSGNNITISSTNSTYTGSASIIAVGNSFQRAALTGDVTAGQNSNVLTLINTGVTAGTYNQVTVNSKGLVTNATNVSTGIKNIWTDNSALPGPTNSQDITLVSHETWGLPMALYRSPDFAGNALFEADSDQIHIYANYDSTVHFDLTSDFALDPSSELMHHYTFHIKSNNVRLTLQPGIYTGDRVHIVVAGSYSGVVIDGDILTPGGTGAIDGVVGGVSFIWNPELGLWVQTA